MSRKVMAGLLLLLFPLSLILAQAGATAPGLYEQGREAQGKGQYYQAIELYRSSLDINSAYEKPMLGLVECYFVLEEYEEALKYIQHSLKYAGQNLALYNMEGRIQIARGELDKAEKLFTRVLTKEPNNMTALMGMAELDIARGLVINAENRYLGAIRLFPRNRRALLSLTLLYDSVENPQKAQQYLEQALRFYPNNPQTRYVAALHYFQNRELDYAESQARLALDIQPLNLDVSLLLCQILMEQKKYSDVIPLLGDLLKRESKNYLLWYDLGVAYGKLDEIEQAISSYARALNLRSDDEITRIKLENILISKLGMEAVQRKQFADYHFKLGKSLEQKNYFNRALEEYRRGLKIDPFSKEGRVLYADILYKLGFPARYTSELKVLKDQGDTDEIILDKLEAQESLLGNNLASVWGVDQFLIDRSKYRFLLFYQRTGSKMLHYLGEEAVARYLKDRFLHYENISFSGDPQVWESYAHAFSRSREAQVDYFIAVTAEEGEKVFHIVSKVYQAKTGVLLDSEEIYRTGNRKVSEAVGKLAARIHSLLPLRGTIIKRNFSRGLINLGRYDGLKKDDKLIIVKSGRLFLQADQIGVDFDPEDLLGQLTIEQTDELIADGKLENRYFFDMINEGDEVVFLKGEIPEEQKPTYSLLDLNRNILKISDR